MRQAVITSNSVGLSPIIAGYFADYGARAFATLGILISYVFPCHLKFQSRLLPLRVCAMYIRSYWLAPV